MLGLDPALAGATGYGVVESDGRRCRMVRLGALRPARPATAAERKRANADASDVASRANAGANRVAARAGAGGVAAGADGAAQRATGASSVAAGVNDQLCRIHQLVCDLIDEFAPHSVAVESVFTALNRKTALRLAEVRGVVLLAAAQKGVPVRSYSPREIKAHVSGYGNAGKEQMQQMVRALLGLVEIPEPADAADALAVALCHIQAAQAEARLAAGFALARRGERGGKLAARQVSGRAAHTANVASGRAANVAAGPAVAAQSPARATRARASAASEPAPQATPRPLPAIPVSR